MRRDMLGLTLSPLALQVCSGLPAACRRLTSGPGNAVATYDAVQTCSCPAQARVAEDVRRGAVAGAAGCDARLAQLGQRMDELAAASKCAPARGLLPSRGGGSLEDLAWLLRRCQVAAGLLHARKHPPGFTHRQLVRRACAARARRGCPRLCWAAAHVPASLSMTRNGGCVGDLASSAGAAAPCCLPSKSPHG